MDKFTLEEKLKIINLKSDLITFTTKMLNDKYASDDDDFIETIDILYRMSKENMLDFLLLSGKTINEPQNTRRIKDYFDNIYFLINIRRFSIKNNKSLTNKINELIIYLNKLKNIDNETQAKRITESIINESEDLMYISEYMIKILEDKRVLNYLLGYKVNVKEDEPMMIFISIDSMYKQVPDLFEMEFVEENEEKLLNLIENNDKKEFNKYIGILQENRKEYLKKLTKV